MFALLVACWHHPRAVDHLYPTDEVAIVGHRGARDLAPENTLAGFDVPASLGFGFELDVMLSADGELVVIHDDDLSRTTDGDGFVDELEWSVIAGLDAGSHFSADFAGEPVPRLGDALAHYGQDVVIDIEIKSPRDKATRAELAGAVAALVEQHGLEDRVLVTSFDPFVLEALRLANPEIRRGQLYGTFDGSDLSGSSKFILKHLLLNKKAQPDVLAVEDAFLSARYVRKMRRKGYRILVWTVDDPERMKELAEWGVDGVITDRPDLAREALRH